MSTRTKKIIVAGVIVASVAVFCSTLVRAALFVPDSGTLPPFGSIATSSGTAAASGVETPPPSDPLRLLIPSLSINAAVQYVGVTKGGAMGVPNNFTDVAWYKYGTIPGQIGSAVIDGHVDNALSLPGVFKHLGSIKVGDDVYVETASSTRLHFVVTDVELYPYMTLPLERIFTTSGGAFLNLITCTGTWNQSVKEYDQRLVVYTKLVNP